MREILELLLLPAGLLLIILGAVAYIAVAIGAM